MAVSVQHGPLICDAGHANLPNRQVLFPSCVCPMLITVWLNPLINEEQTSCRSKIEEVHEGTDTEEERKNENQCGIGVAGPVANALKKPCRCHIMKHSSRHCSTVLVDIAAAEGRKQAMYAGLTGWGPRWSLHLA